MSYRKLLVCSIGNPGKYLGTRHSAGHLAMESLRSALSYPPFYPDRKFGGEISRGNFDSGLPYTLFKSPSLMNVSGGPVKQALMAFLNELPVDERATAQLVVLHDELEAKPGKIKARTGGSLKGHNGLKSIAAALGTKDFTRISVGIGRPESANKGDVVDYVLGRITSAEKEAIQSTIPAIVGTLAKIAER